MSEVYYYAIQNRNGFGGEFGETAEDALGYFLSANHAGGYAVADPDGKFYVWQVGNPELQAILECEDLASLDEFEKGKDYTFVGRYTWYDVDVDEDGNEIAIKFD